MLGGAINRSASGKKVIVQHSEEVVAITVSGSNTAKVPFPKDHLTNEYLNPFAKKGTNVRFINYGPTTGTSETAGCRTQVIVDDPVTVGSSSDDTYASLDNATFELKFSNPAMGISEKAPEAGDHIRIFWEEEVEAEDAAVEVVISPSTFPGTLAQAA